MAWDDKIPAADKPFYKITRFRPDTCGCILTFAWDTRSSEEDRKHIPADIEHACDAHKQHIKSGKKVKAHHDEVIGENRDKNIAMAHLLDCLDDEHCEHVKDQEGKPMRAFKFEPRFRYNDKRELEIELDGAVPAAHKRDLAAKLKTHCGARKVHLK